MFVKRVEVFGYGGSCDRLTGLVFGMVTDERVYKIALSLSTLHFYCFTRLSIVSSIIFI